MSQVRRVWWSRVLAGRKLDLRRLHTEREQTVSTPPLQDAEEVVQSLMTRVTNRTRFALVDHI